MPRRLRPRVDTLAARVRWLDRYRRAVAVLAACAAAPYVRAWLGHELGAEWPRFYTLLLAVMLAVMVWMIVEVGLVYVTALWETEQYRLAHDRGLPRAILVRGGRW
ncbi:MAG TPA: hypothetical protein VFP84_16765 [Kofleriaceae bacterium]|nr:hypothetical protein [Kofleriaceae bacterium]